MNILKLKKEILPLTELYEKFSKDIFRYSLSILKNEDEAKDAVQEVFVKYAESESSFKGDCSQKTWLLVITRNYCYNRISNKGFNSGSIDSEVLRRSYENNFEVVISLKDALKTLTSEQNELLYLLEYEGYSYKEIAELTAQTIENVKIKIYRARKKLREILK